MIPKMYNTRLELGGSLGVASKLRWASKRVQFKAVTHSLPRGWGSKLSLTAYQEGAIQNCHSRGAPNVLLDVYVDMGMVSFKHGVVALVSRNVYSSSQIFEKPPTIWLFLKIYKTQMSCFWISALLAISRKRKDLWDICWWQNDPIF